jgi:hypothetical protein
MELGPQALAFEAKAQFERCAMLCLGDYVMKTAFHQGSKSNALTYSQPAHFANSESEISTVVFIGSLVMGTEICVPLFLDRGNMGNRCLVGTTSGSGVWHAGQQKL